MGLGLVSCIGNVSLNVCLCKTGRSDWTPGAHDASENDVSCNDGNSLIDFTSVSVLECISF